MLQKNEDLVTIKNDNNGQIPLVMASLYGHQEMINYLSQQTPIDFLGPRTNDKNGATHLNFLSTNDMYDKALDLLKKYPQLGYAEDIHQNYAIKLLANEPSAFLSGSKLGFWKQWLYSCVPNVHPGEMSSQEPNDEENCQRSYNSELNHGKIKRNKVPKSIKDLKMRHAKALQLLKFILKEIPTLSEEQLRNIGLDQVIYDAIKCGSFEFIEELLTCNAVIIWRVDKKGRTLFAHGITLRQEKIFNLIYRFGSRRRILIMLDVFKNNYLHLAAKLSPSFQLDRVPGAALQMQWELQWFKVGVAIANKSAADGMAITKTSGGDIVNEKRTEDNLETWKECLKNYLIGQGLWGVVSGDEPKPEEIDRNYKDWMKKNALALHAIQISCEEDTISYLMRRFPNIDSAKCMWDNLADMQSEVTSYKEEATSSILEYSSLHMAVEQGDLNTVMGLLKRNPNDES
ncbi:hypothetical protein GH714_001562 [Hevea brasiliensis]|uniref:DUF4219 domain-containing protein n=1 Tax=Hevea brasiliensis TaxID=3981 RepID=A0A6A6M9V0_HEVBR|nr:hypothetical protein GH714_001562 [Hevea brasiliensis]